MMKFEIVKCVKVFDFPFEKGKYYVAYRSKNGAYKVYTDGYEQGVIIKYRGDGLINTGGVDFHNIYFISKSVELLKNHKECKKRYNELKGSLAVLNKLSEESGESFGGFL